MPLSSERKSVSTPTPVDGRRARTFEIVALLLPEARTRLLHPRGQINLYVLGHDLVGAADLARGLALAHHLLDALDAAVAVVEAARDGLRELLNLPLLGPLRVVVVEAGQHVLLVQPLELLALVRDVGQQLRDLVRHVGPARREQVHLDHGIPVVGIVGARRQEAAPVVVGREEHAGARAAGCGGAEAVRDGRGGPIPVALRRVVGVRLPVRDVAVARRVRAGWMEGRQGRLGAGRLCLQIRAVSPHGGRSKGGEAPSARCRKALARWLLFPSSSMGMWWSSNRPALGSFSCASITSHVVHMQ
jgi:hypothetical protein